LSLKKLVYRHARVNRARLIWRDRHAIPGLDGQSELVRVPVDEEGRRDSSPRWYAGREGRTFSLTGAPPVVRLREFLMPELTVQFSVSAGV
jgi:hypothetical protein